MNTVTVIGNVFREPVLKTLPSGVKLVNFTIKDYKKTKVKEGMREEVTYIDCEAWEGTAEFVENFFKEGKPIIVTGELKQDNWTDADGNKRSKLKVRANTINFVPRDFSGKDVSSEDEDKPKVRGRSTNHVVVDEEGSDEEIPF